jgi:hypothetical protein
MLTLSRRELQTLDLHSYHICFHLEAKLAETIIHQLQPGKVLTTHGKSATQEAFHVAFTMQFHITAAKTHW